MSLAGKVRRRACGQHTSELKNARMRGKSCPKALVSPEPERVCLKVGAKPHKSCFSSPGRKRRSVEAPLRTPRALAGGVFSEIELSGDHRLLSRSGRGFVSWNQNP